MHCRAILRRTKRAQTSQSGFPVPTNINIPPCCTLMVEKRFFRPTGVQDPALALLRPWHRRVEPIPSSIHSRKQHDPTSYQVDANLRSPPTHFQRTFSAEPARGLCSIIITCALVVLGKPWKETGNPVAQTEETHLQREQGRHRYLHRKKNQT